MNVTDQPTPQTPLSLEYFPEKNHPDERPVIVVEPSFAFDGHIFVGIHARGTREGLHLPPDDARRVMNHLSKLLIEVPERPEEPLFTEPFQQKGIERIKKRLKLPLRFRFEFKLGRVMGVVGTLEDE